MRTIAFVLTLGLSACGFHPTGSDMIDSASALDGAVLDAVDDDGSLIDGSPDIDALRIDAAAIDATAIDATAIDARPACPGTYNVNSGGARYSYRATTASIATAIADCADDLVGRTHLATFEGADLDTVLSATTASSNLAVYVGAACPNAVADCSDTSNWTWLGAGGAVAASLWADNEPVDMFPWTFTERFNGQWQLVSSHGVTARSYLCECEP